jgi:glycosyltransferase involved in cell wall biosynthesis
VKLVIIIPALNEAKTIALVIQAIPKDLTGITKQEVIVTDDGSTDQTKNLAEAAGARVISHPHPQGVGAAFQTGLRAALMSGADLIVNLDADGQFNPRDIPALISPILSHRADFVSATRFKDSNNLPNMPALKLWGNRQVTRLVNFLTGQNFTDCSCGFRAYSREAALRLVLFGKFTYTQEVLIDLAYKNLRLAEVPLTIRGEREHGESRVAKSVLRYAVKSATIMFRTARDYKPFDFFGVPGLILTGLGFLGALVLLINYLATGHTSPFRSLVSISGALIITGVILFSLSMIADMQHRNRQLLEEILYLTKKNKLPTQ